jgi:hypothetical protein
MLCDLVEFRKVFRTDITVPVLFAAGLFVEWHTARVNSSLSMSGEIWAPSLLVTTPSIIYYLTTY